MKFLRIILLCVLVALLIMISSLLRPRYIYQKGITQLRLKNYPQAQAHFQKAEQAMPVSISTWFARADLFRIYTNYGQTLYHLGIKDWKENGLSMAALDTLKLSRSYLAKAAVIEPNHYINAYRQTRTEQALEKAYPWLHPAQSKAQSKTRQNPYNAEPFYQKTLPLRPSGITVRYAYLKYLESKKQNKKIPELVQYMMEIYPPSYFQLKREPFYTPDLLPYIEKGLTAALEKNILPQDALKAFSNIYLSQNNLEKAISWYKELLAFKPDSNTPGSYIHLGHLYLKDNQQDNSFFFFKKAIAAGKTPGLINQIYGRFKQEKRFAAFLSFTLYLQENFPESPKFNQFLDMAIATCWLDMGHPQLAKARLIKITAAKPHAPAYYTLARIAAKEKDWSQMETAIQKASLLEPSNLTYYNLLVQALMNQKKYTHAEEIYTKAIAHAPLDNPWVYNNRARLRWKLKQYKKAAQDWEKAFAIKPDQSDFPYRIALALEQQGQFKQALTFAQKALALAPDNKTYKDLIIGVRPRIK